MNESSTVLRAWLYSRTNFDTEDHARKLVSYLLAQPRFAPDHYGDNDRTLTPERIDDAVSLIVNRVGQELDLERAFSMVFFERKRPPLCSYRVEWSKLPHRAFALSSYDIKCEFIKLPEEVNDWLDFIFGLLELHDAWYALFALDVETQAKNYLSWHRLSARARDQRKGVQGSRGVGVELNKGIPGVYWGNYFGPFYVDWFGHERLESLPCLEKRWLPTGGIFFTTAPTPFDWDTREACELQRGVRDHLGADAFFDIDTVRWVLSALEPIPDSMEPEQLQPPRRIPPFPFPLEKPTRKPVEEEIEEAMRYFVGKGFKYVNREKQTLTFRDYTGGVTRVTVGPDGVVEYWPKQEDRGS